MTIHNTDGSVYMTFPPAIESRGDLQGWTVRHVCSGTHAPICPHGKVNGTYAVSRTDVESFNGLNKIISELADLYGYRPLSSRIGATSYRWTFEREYPGGHRGSDMIIASLIG